MEGGSDAVMRACREVTAAHGPLSLWKLWFPLQRASCRARGQPPSGSLCHKSHWMEASGLPTTAFWWCPTKFQLSYPGRTRPFSSTDSGSRRNSSPCSSPATAAFQRGCWQQHLTSPPRVLLLVSQAASSPRLDCCPGFTSAEG